MDVENAILQSEIDKLKRKRDILQAKKNLQKEHERLRYEVKHLSPSRFGKTGEAMKRGYKKMQQVSMTYGPRLQRVESELFTMGGGIGPLGRTIKKK